MGSINFNKLLQFPLSNEGTSMNPNNIDRIKFWKKEIFGKEKNQNLGSWVRSANATFALLGEMEVLEKRTSLFESPNYNRCPTKISEVNKNCPKRPNVAKLCRLAFSDFISDASKQRRKRINVGSVTWIGTLRDLETFESTHLKVEPFVGSGHVLGDRQST